MKMHLSRAVTAVGLGASLWFGSISAFAAPQQSKDQDQTASKSQSQTAQKDQDTKPAPTQQASKGGPLSTNEDPTKIGQRNINKGIWAGGILGAKGIDSEVRLGRQLAAQVDKEAKFVDDPIIGEYVNRV